MKSIKSIIPLLLVLTLIFSTLGPAFAWPPGFKGELIAYLSATSDDGTVHVGDTVYIYVNPVNEGDSDWENVVIYAPIPDGLKYVSHEVPDRKMQMYEPSTGLWTVDQMLAHSRGSDKTLIITCKVLPEAMGKSITIPARSVKFTSLKSVYDPYHTGGNVRVYDVASLDTSPVNVIRSSFDAAIYDPPNADFTATPTSGTAPLLVQFTDTSRRYVTSWFWDFGDGSTSTEQNPSHTYTALGNHSVRLTVRNDMGSDTTTQTITVTGDLGNGGNSTGNNTGNGIGNTNGNGRDLLDLSGNTKLADALKNLTAADGNDPLLNLHTGGSGGGNAYEVSTNSPQVPDQWVWYGLAILLIVGLLAAGYFYGIRRDQ